MIRVGALHSKNNSDPPPTHLIKRKLDLKTERDYAEIKLQRNPMPKKLDMFELKNGFV